MQSDLAWREKVARFIGGAPPPLGEEGNIPQLGRPRSPEHWPWSAAGASLRGSPLALGTSPPRSPAETSEGKSLESDAGQAEESLSRVSSGCLAADALALDSGRRVSLQMGGASNASQSQEGARHPYPPSIFKRIQGQTPSIVKASGQGKVLPALSLSLPPSLSLSLAWCVLRLSAGVY